MRLLHLPCFAAQYHRLMAEDPPEHPARPPCTLKALLRPITRFPPTVRAKHGQVPDLSAVLLFREGVMDDGIHSTGHCDPAGAGRAAPMVGRHAPHSGKV